MAPSRLFSIFLLKSEYDAAAALRKDNTLSDNVPATGLPAGATLFVLDGIPQNPWWKSYFGIQQDLLQASKGALVFLPVQDRVFVLAFGRVGHNLRDESYEYDFGIRVTLNCIDPTKLKNIDTLRPDTARRQRTQHAIETGLTYFDFDNDTSILKSVTGKTKAEYADMLKHATGASSLRVSTAVESANLVDLCTRLLALYAEDSYLESFPDIHKITPVRDPERVSALNHRLREQIRERADNVSMSIPDLIDYSQGGGSTYVTFSGAGRSLLYQDVSITHYYEYLSGNGVQLSSLTIERLKTHQLRLGNDVDDIHGSCSVFRSLLFDTTLPGSDAAFHLTEGNWYEVDRDYVRSLQVGLDQFWSDLTFLEECRHTLEPDYNTAVGEKPGFVCLDRTTVSPKGQTQLEPCDLYTVIDHRAALVHVKFSTTSSQLSHLFNQGTNSVELLKSEEGAPERLIALLTEKHKEGDDIDALTEPVRAGNYTVVFAIITWRDPNNRSLNLPLFSRISLARTVKVLHRLMNVPVSFGFVKDASVRAPARPKPRKVRKSSTAEGAA